MKLNKILALEMFFEEVYGLHRSIANKIQFKRTKRSNTVIIQKYTIILKVKIKFIIKF